MVVPTSESDSGAAVDNSRSILETEIVGQIHAQEHAISDRSFLAALLVLGAEAIAATFPQAE
jgi:hypothetical protein